MQSASNHVSDSNHQLASRSAILAVFACFIAGCADDQPIREYTVEREEEQVFTSDLLKSEFPSIPLKWKAPAEWVIAENDQFSTMAWSTGPEDKEARITVSAVPSAAGVEPQIVRWGRQIGLPNSEQMDPMKDVEELPLGDDLAQYVNMSGEQETILGMILQHEDRLWIFKLKGTNSVADDAADSFREFCESVRIVRTAGE